ncbi:hypothetical protein MOXK23_21660 (plasmid) [Moraxella sp. K23]|jgi:transposase InsO family protein|uniref:integrase core domain-containing protein n=1 Tax=Moraxella tetraodonis TaxID=2767221 RepID=UPI00211CB4E9|nr:MULTISPECIES: integrase core domain-containing protein [Moraxella]
MSIFDKVFENNSLKQINSINELYNSLDAKNSHAVLYLRQFDTVSQARAGLKDYFEFYNYERLHQSLDYHTPAQVYLNNSSVNPVFYQLNSILIL